MSLDPAMRTQMSIRTYVEPVPLGTVMRAQTVSEVVEDGGGLKRGTLVTAPGGWQEYYAAHPKELQPVDVPADLPLSSALGVLGGTGLTAYFGLLRVGQPKAGETVLVSGAAGATGNVVCQIAKHVVGCKVVGIAGGADKCRWLVDSLGLDAAIDYKAVGSGAGLNKAILEHCPKGVDVYFDNVGGDMLNQALRRMRLFGRIVMCGAISGYNMIGGEDKRVDIKAQYAAAIVSQRVRLQGFIITDYVKEFGAGKRELAEWIRQGKIRNQETVVEGLQHAGAAFRGLFEGVNIGKLIVKISDARESKPSVTMPPSSKL